VLRLAGRIGLFWNIAVHDPAVHRAFEAQGGFIRVGYTTTLITAVRRP
jgi:hypothetical protein